MVRSLWSRLFNRKSEAPRLKPSGKRSGRRVSCRPRLEILEDRTVPSTVAPTLLAWVPQASGTTDHFRAVWGSGPNDVFAVGRTANNLNGVIYHYDGTSWTPQTIPPYPTDPIDPNGQGQPLSLISVWGSGQDVWAVGGAIVSGTNHFGVIVLHSTDDGNHWAWETDLLRELAIPPSVAIPTSDASWAQKAVWSDEFGDVYVVGNGPSISYSHDKGDNWTVTFPQTGDSSLTGVWGSGRDDVYAVSTSGSILHSTDRGSTWDFQRTPGLTDRNAFLGMGGSGNDVYAVGRTFTPGANSPIIHNDGPNGSIWTAPDSRTTNALLSVWASGSLDVYAVGDKGTILHSSDGDTWNPEVSGTPNQLTGVWGSRTNDVNYVNDVFAVGVNGTILHLERTLAVTTPINENDVATLTGTITDPDLLDTHTVVINWGDGSTNSTLSLPAGVLNFNATHQYPDNPTAAATSYAISATVTDKDGGSGTGTISVEVDNVAPTATLSAPATVSEGSSFSVALTSPSDPSTTDTSAGFHYAFATDGASLASATYATSGTAAAASFTFDDGPRDHTITERIFDKDGGFTDYTASIHVSNVAPTAHLTNPSTAPGSQVSFTLTASDPSPVDQAAGFPFILDWGDGTPRYTGPGGRPAHAYLNAGLYTVSLWARDKDGDLSVTPDTALLIVGSSHGDSTTLSNGPTIGDLQVTINNTTYGGPGQPPVHPTGPVVVFGGSGNDQFTVNTTVPGGLVLDGQGGGNDRYTVHFGRWAGSSVTVHDTSSNAGRLEVFGVSGSDPNYITKMPGVITYGSTPTPTETVNVTGVQPQHITVTAQSTGYNFIGDPSDGDTTLNGGPGVNEILVTATLGGGTTINGGPSTNLYKVDLGNLAGPVSIFNSNPGANDSLIVSGTAGNDVINFSGSQIAAAGQAAVILTAPLASLTIEGGDGDDQVAVANVTTPIGSLTLEGGAGSDTISLNNLGAQVAALTVDGGGGPVTDVLQVHGSLPPTVTLQHVIPVASLTGPADGVRGQPLAFTAGALGSAAATFGFTYTITWGDSSPTQTTAATPGNGTGLTVSHVFTATGTYTVTVTVTDHGGLVSQSVSESVTVTAVALQPDACNPGGAALVVGGTLGNDTIVFSPVGNSGRIQVMINGVSQGVFSPTGRLIAFGQAGDDDIQVADSITNSTWLYGGAGNDQLNAGNGGSLLIGGDGNDQLTGGSGRDVMIGGQGADKLIGNANDDILIAGYTTMDNRSMAGSEEFWCHILEEWTSSNSFADRVANLRGATSQNANAHNGTAYLMSVVMDDNMEDEIDMLQGSSGNDWFIYLAGEDKVVGQQEAVN